MCLIGVSMKMNQQFPFIIAANRDEFLNRPALPLHQWSGSPSIYGGQDLKKGGMWMGVNSEGKVAAITNVREWPPVKRKKSRGELVKQFLLNEESSEQYLAHLRKKESEFDGYNLFVGNPDRLVYGSNRNQDQFVLKEGIYGLSNAALDTSWPKVERIKHHLSILHSCENRNKLIDELFLALSDSEPYPKEQLPNTGVGEELEKLLSPVFISTPDYGTRSSTVIVMDRNRHLSIVERRYEEGKTFETTFELQIPGQKS
ncbi:NRDE family protein [Alteribacter populi]|uniref:NRDE family protein n=1 Tax=Alteribacter populi TaxID=2011011 RepID=UPI000BBB53FC|nr:NRDE family protein [Alteribacter populi]